MGHNLRVGSAVYRLKKITSEIITKGIPADEKLLLQHFTPYIEKGALTNLPAYNFYIRVKAEEPMEPTSGETIVPPKGQASLEQAE
jgi:hypothetical protein